MAEVFCAVLLFETLDDFEADDFGVDVLGAWDFVDGFAALPEPDESCVEAELDWLDWEAGDALDAGALVS